MRHRFWLAALLLVSLSGCISVQSQRSAGPYSVHHHTWWNYYQRGRLYLKDREFEKARQDFETALGRLPGARTAYMQERWKARTYGMHMIEGYFPHRELGICLFELDQLPEALDLLETSLQMEPSARAKFYINRIRQRLAVAATPPRIELPATPNWTRQRTYTLQGTVRGPNAVAALTINGEPEFIELASPLLHFERALQLKEGSNTVHIAVTDVAGRQCVTNLVLRADWTPPQVHLHRAGAALSITCEDQLALQRVQINDQTLFPSKMERSLTLPLATDEPLQLTATDRAGNTLEWGLSKKELRHLAQNQPAAPPRLQLADSGKTITLCTPEYALDIQAEDDTALQTVSLNGSNLLTRTSPLFRTLRRIPLKEGPNQLRICAEDSEGNRTEEQLTAIYRPPEYMDRMYRLATALSPVSGEIPTPRFGHRLNQLIGQELTRDPVRFYLLASDREARRLENEQKLSNSDLTDPRAKLKLNQVLRADLSFVTRVLSDGEGQTVYTEVVDTDSGEKLFIEDVYLEDAELLPQQIGGLIMKIEQRFPLIQAGVLQQNKQLCIDAGEKNGAQKNMRLLIIRSDGPFEQGRVIQAGNRPAELIISRVESESARVIIPRGQKRDSAQPGDYVFSR